MKKTLLKPILLGCTIASSCISVAKAQTIFTYGSNPVSKAEFLKAYNKNKTPVTDKAASYKEYLELYIKFKLKVQAAKDARLDTLQQLKYDLQNFRSQVEEGYLQDDNAINALVDEALERSRKDIHLIHFAINMNRVQGADTAKAYQAIEQLKNVLAKGETDYAKAITSIGSSLPITWKDLGYITAFSLPYFMENIVYKLQPGGVSNAYRSKSTLHLFVNAGEKQSAGRWKVAQILFAAPPDASAEELASIKKQADSVYTILQSGASFAAMAKQFSADRLTYQNGGELAEFGTGKYDPTFEKAVFALQQDGEISKPILTSHGFHIVKRIQQIAIPAGKNDEAFVASLRQQILQDDRVAAAKENFSKAVLQKSGYSRNAAIKDEQLFRYADSVVAQGEVGKYPVNKQVIFSFLKQKVTGSDWLNFVKDYKLNTDVYKGEDNKALLEKYISITALEYYRKHLEEYNTDFKYQLQEFKEGNMLFEIMDRNVWTKASADSLGLKKFYDGNKQAYQWAESAAVYLFTCTSLQAADSAVAALKAGKNWKLVADESEGSVQADSGMYELNQLQLPADLTPANGVITKPVLNSGDNSASFVQIIKLFPAGEQRTFDEAKGMVINEYQNALEEKWIASLKKKYPVKVNEAVFKELLK